MGRGVLFFMLRTMDKKPVGDYNKEKDRGIQYYEEQPDSENLRDRL